MENIANIKFRKLLPHEIEARISSISEKGVQLLLYKDARCDANILDETVGSLNWQRDHKEIKGAIYAGCGIWDEEKGIWNWKWDAGKESAKEAEKGGASDSFKRACFAQGIGRELYTAPFIWISADYLETLSYTEVRNVYVCYDTFVVSDISYVGNVIKSVTIDIYNKGKKHHTRVFSNPEYKMPATPETSSVPIPEEPKPIVKSKTTADSALFKDDEVILFGNCNSKTYGEVKNTATFKSFLNWVKKYDTTYPEPEKMDQYIRFKKLAELEG